MQLPPSLSRQQQKLQEIQRERDTRKARVHTHLSRYAFICTVSLLFDHV